jgi:hypothetical protein
MNLRNCLATVGLLALLLGGCAAEPENATTLRQAEVADKGRAVMPFDLDRTTHRFTPTEDGLLEQVVADQAGDEVQTGLIRQHLAHEARRFQAGDFGDPARIHGPGMPGLAELSAGAARITVTYADLSGGASLTFRTSDPALVTALHQWGAAQVADHGKHAEPGRGQQHNHP